LCNSKNLETWKKGKIKSVNVEEFKITDHQYGKHWDLLRCKDCEFIFSDPFPPVEISKIYERIVDPDMLKRRREEGETSEVF